jgi:hypothetical protein
MATAGKPLLSAHPSLEASLFAQRVIEEEEKEKEKKQKKEEQVLKSPPKAFMMSVLVPGTGELYAGKKRGFVFIGLEVAAWAAYYFYHDSGKDKEAEFERFADLHYSTSKLADPDDCNDATAAARLDSLRQVDPQHYYEDLGKYDKFICGWTDVVLTPDSTYYSANRMTYRSMRSKSNDLLRTARYFTMIALLNHVVSAIDAVKAVRGYNEALTKKTGLRLEYQVASNHARIGVAYKF